MPMGGSRRTVSHLAFAKEIRAEILETDKYGRQVALHYLPDGRCLQKERPGQWVLPAAWRMSCEIRMAGTRLVFSTSASQRLGRAYARYTENWSWNFNMTPIQYITMKAMISLRMTPLAIAIIVIKPMAQEVFIAKNWISWFENWGTTETVYQMPGHEETVSVEVDSDSVCFIWNRFLESRCFPRSPAKDASSICWTNGPKIRDCASRSDVNFITVKEKGDSIALLKVPDISTYEYRNRLMVGGVYMKEKKRVEFNADGKISGFMGFTRYFLHLIPNDSKPENVKIHYENGSSSQEYFINKIKGSLILRKAECLEESIDPVCTYPIGTTIQHIFRKATQ